MGATTLCAGLYCVLTIKVRGGVTLECREDKGAQHNHAMLFKGFRLWFSGQNMIWFVVFTLLSLVSAST